MKRIKPCAHKARRKIRDQQKLRPSKIWPKTCSIVVQFLCEDSSLQEYMQSRKKKVFFHNLWRRHKENCGTVNIQNMKNV